MSVKDAVAKRFIELLKERDMNVNQLAIISGVTASTVYSLLDESRRDVSIVTVKKLCDGLEITLGEFFNVPLFNELEQKFIKFLKMKKNTIFLIKIEYCNL